MLSVILWMLMAQEFELHENGFIYDAPTMMALQAIVASEQEAFEACEQDLVFRGRSQSLGRYAEFQMTEEDGRAMFDRLSSGQSDWNSMIEENRFALIQIYSDVLLLDESSETSSALSIIGALAESVYFEVQESRGLHFWSYNAGIFKIVELNRPFVNPVMHEKYGRLIQYVDCMVDPETAIIMTRSLPSTPITLAREQLGQMIGLIRPNLEAIADHNLRREKAAAWQERFWARVDELSDDQAFTALVAQACAEAIASGLDDETLEGIVARTLPSESLLQLKRSYQVIGGCSMDTRPRTHALEIAKLAAQTRKWDIFLRAHLDIMNDNFDRMSDGSYAWGPRQTYLAELEYLDIHVLDLILGTNLSIDSKNHHYTASPGRLGRTMTESMDRQLFETHVVSAINDKQLDPWNRVRFLYLYGSYVFQLGSDSFGLIEDLKDRFDTLPHYLQSLISILQKELAGEM